MTIFGRLFQPAWWSIGLTLLGVALFCSLGVWQLQRADYKSGIMTLYQQRLAEDYRTTSIGALRTEDQRYRKVELEGGQSPASGQGGLPRADAMGFIRWSQQAAG